MTVSVLWVGSDNVLEVSGLRNGMTGALLTSASVTVHLRDQAGADAGGGSWPQAMAEDSEIPGTYRTTLADTLTLTPGVRLTAEIIADGGPGLRASWFIDITTKRRRV